jgi:hypothetical protein
MKKVALLLIALSILITLASCQDPGANPGKTGSTLTIRIENIPSADGHIARIDIVEDKGGGLFQQTGYADATVTGNYIAAVIKEYSIIGGEKTTTKYFADNPSCNIAIYIDMDGNGVQQDSGDIADAVTHSVVISGNTVKVIQYDTLNVVL